VTNPEASIPEECAVRRAVTADAGEIARLVSAAYSPWVPLMGYQPMPMRVDYSEAVGHHRFDLLDASGEIIGLVETDIEDDCLVVVNLAIAPQWQHRGLGRALLAHAETIARDSECDRIRLYTNAVMSSNIALYRAVGYGIDGEQAVNGGTIVHLSKPLPASASVG
jgi:ribosomal protein S18 acetylase RimI-like enzyme